MLVALAFGPAVVLAGTASAAAAQGTTTTTTSGSSPTPQPVVTLFLPAKSLSNLAASVIKADPDQTTYAIGCMTAGQCSLSTSVTVTEGASTAIYTVSFRDQDGTSFTASPETINCDLHGTPWSATQAVCTRRSAISGLGDAAWTTTLAGAEVSYKPVTVTAGADKLPSSSAGRDSSAAAGGGARATARPWMAAAAAVVGGGAVGMAVFGIGAL